MSAPNLRFFILGLPVLSSNISLNTWSVKNLTLAVLSLGALSIVALSPVLILRLAVSLLLVVLVTDGIGKRATNISR